MIGDVQSSNDRKFFNISRSPSLYSTSFDEERKKKYTSDMISHSKLFQYLVILILIIIFYFKFNEISSCVIVLRESDGRLGNRMFMYASAYGISRKYQCRLVIHEDLYEYLNRYFQIDFMENNLLIYLKSVRKIFNGCQLDLLNVIKNEIIELTGYWQSYKYFHYSREDILRQFTFKNQILRQLSNQLKDHHTFNLISKIIDEISENSFERQKMIKNLIKNRLNKTLIGIHFRRGDFLDKKHLGFQVSSIDYIIQAMHYFSQQYSNSLFILSSDDKLWCQNNFKHIENLLITPINLTPIEDFALLTFCQHTIITSGTYGWWIAFLTQGQVIYDHNYPIKNSWLDQLCPQKNYIPSWFTKI